MLRDFALMNLEDYKPIDLSSKMEKLSLADKWILHQVDEVTDNVTKLMEKYELGEAASELYDFIWTQFCDWYIEMAKIPLL